MKPILFNTDMVRAILANRKTATRRVVKPQPLSKLAYCCMGYKHGTWAYPDKDAWKYWDDEGFRLPDNLPDKEKDRRWTPPYRPGDILYVRETWTQDGDVYRYKAGFYDQNRKWRPPIHMPREAARIFLRVMDVRVERLQDIDDDGVVAEGLEIGDPFDELWDSALKRADRTLYGWDANPYVWVIEFERISKEEAEKSHAKST